ncbi:hypothetical protein Gasu2_42860 [Galdieria sulphuraria]|nr:hypothetical protein Gasu2_42860 [Galdieria sulphuraria]
MVLEKEEDTIPSLELRYLQWRYINIQFEKQLQIEEKEYQHLLQQLGNQLANSSLFNDGWLLQLWKQQTKQQALQFQYQLIEKSKQLLNQVRQLGWQPISTLDSLRQTVCFYQENIPTLANHHDLVLLERRIHQWIIYLIHAKSRCKKEKLEYNAHIKQLESDWKQIQQVIEARFSCMERGANNSIHSSF